MEEGKKKRSSLNGSFVTGAIALVFLIIGYEVALFVHKAAVTRIAANRDAPDTVYVYAEKEEIPPLPPVGRNDKSRQSPSVISSEVEKSPRAERHNAPHSAAVKEVRAKLPRQVESFRFNPNTVSVEDLQRLGFSEKQAQSIENYRLKGGRFRRPTDFAKSYVVADSVYARLEPFIDIPRLDINKADSVALLDLPGIGAYFAGKIVQYRTQLGGYSSAEQLMDFYADFYDVLGQRGFIEHHESSFCRYRTIRMKVFRKVPSHLTQRGARDCPFPHPSCPLRVHRGSPPESRCALPGPCHCARPLPDSPRTVIFFCYICKI